MKNGMKIFCFMIFHITILIVSKPLRIKFENIDGFIIIFDGSGYLTLFDSENYDTIYNRIRCLISLKSRITYVFSHYFLKIKVYSYDSLPIEKRLALPNLIILIKSALTKIKALLL